MAFVRIDPIEIDPGATNALARPASADRTLSTLFGGGVDVVGLERQLVYLVRSDQLQSLKDSSQAESLWLGFFSSCAALFVGAILTWISASEISPMRTAVYVAILGVLLLGSAVFGILWSFANRTKNIVLTRLESGENVIPFDFPTMSLPNARNRGTSPAAGNDPQ